MEGASSACDVPEAKGRFCVHGHKDPDTQWAKVNRSDGVVYTGVAGGSLIDFCAGLENVWKCQDVMSSADPIVSRQNVGVFFFFERTWTRICIEIRVRTNFVLGVRGFCVWCVFRFLSTNTDCASGRLCNRKRLLRNYSPQYDKETVTRCVCL